MFQRSLSMLLLTSVLVGLCTIPLAAAATRLGLHTTAEELAIWRQRAISGPYKSLGDVSSNSPGDWDRIDLRAEIFRDDPLGGIWPGPGGSGCVSGAAGHAPYEEARWMRDGAFKALIKNDNDLKVKVRDWLLTQQAEPNLDFANRTRWCIDGGQTTEQPIGEWLTIILHAMDYIEILDPNVFSPGQRTTMRDWFVAWADMFSESIKLNLNAMFVDRQNGNYAPTQGPFYDPAIPYMNADRTPGQELSHYAERYNNRKGSGVLGAMSIAVKFNVPSVKAEMKLYAKEFIMFAVFPLEFMSDFERAVGDGIPDNGWQYACHSFWSGVLGPADMLAREGDPSVYNFTTSAGLYGSEGGPKSPFFALTFMYKYEDLSLNRYGTDNPDNAGDPNYRIDGRYLPGPVQALNSLYLLPANVFYKSPYIKGAYMRTNPGTIPYPHPSNSQNGDLDYQGAHGIFPGALLMFGDMENKVNPFNGDVTPTPRASRRPIVFD